MKLWFLIVFLLLGVTLWMFLREDIPPEEGFQSAGAPSTWKSLRTSFHYQWPLTGTPPVPQQILMDSKSVGEIPNLGEQLTSAMKSSPVYFGDSPVEDYSRRFKVTGFGDRIERAKACLAIRRPEDIDRSPDAEEGCGWVYRADGTSHAAYGNSKKALVKLAKLENEDKWIWDKTEAIKAETIKRCAAIKNCQFINTDPNCAFCSDKGHGIPYNPVTGQSLYLDLTCPSTLIHTTNNCPVLPLGANTVLPSRCAGNEFDAGCSGAMLEALGFSKSGDLWKFVTNAEGAITKDAADSLLAMITGKDAAVFKPTAPTKTLKTTLLNKARLILAARNSQDPLERGAANQLISGSAVIGGSAPTQPFQICDYVGDLANSRAAVKRAEAIRCLQQEFRMAGCQAQGSNYPKTDTIRAYNGLSLTAIRQKFKDLYNSMYSATRVTEQKEAVQKCLGVGMTDSTAFKESGPFCQERGIEYFVFSGPTFVGRIVSDVGLLVDPLSGIRVPASGELQRLLAINRYPDVGYIARTMVSIPGSSPVTMEDTWNVPPNAYIVRVNGELVKEDQQPNVTSPPYESYKWRSTLVSTDRNQIEILYKGKPSARWGNPQYTYIQNNLPLFQLSQESTKSVISFPFFRSTTADTNKVAKLDDRYTQFETMGERVGITWKTKPAAPGQVVRVYEPRIAKEHMNLISTMIYPVKTGGIVFRLFVGVAYEEYLEVSNTSMTYVLRRDGTEERKELSVVGKIQPMVGRWVHLAVDYQVDPSKPQRQTIAVWADGASIGTFVQEIQNQQGFRQDVEIQLLDAGFEGAMSWFHMYDNVWKVDRAGTPIEGFKGSSKEGFSVSISDIFKNEIAAEKGEREAPKAELAVKGPPAARTDYTPAFVTEADTPVDYPGMKFKGTPYKTTTAENTRACADICKADTNCLGFSFTTGGKCELFNKFELKSGTNEPATEAAAQTVSAWSGRNRNLIDARDAAASQLRLFYGVTWDSVSSTAGYSATEPSLVNFLQGIEMKDSLTGKPTGKLYEAGMFPPKQVNILQTQVTEPRVQKDVEDDLKSIYSSNLATVNSVVVKYVYGSQEDVTIPGSVGSPVSSGMTATLTSLIQQARTLISATNHMSSNPPKNRLNVGESIKSINNKYELKILPEGNIVILRDTTPIWSSQDSWKAAKGSNYSSPPASTFPPFIYMGIDGNLFISYDGNYNETTKTSTWFGWGSIQDKSYSPNTSNQPYSAVLQNDGILHIRDKNNVSVWNSMLNYKYDTVPDYDFANLSETVLRKYISDNRT